LGIQGTEKVKKNDKVPHMQRGREWHVNSVQMQENAKVEGKTF
jgi:hypothetical protein